MADGAPISVWSDAVHISVLSENNMGQLRDDGRDVAGEDFLRRLVSNPASVVADLTNASEDDWCLQESEIVADLASAPDKRARNAIKKRIPALVPGRFRNKHRAKEDCEGRQIIGHDLDENLVADSFEQACAHVRAKLPNRYLAIHTTATERNEDGTWRLRVYELLDRPATVAEWDQRIKPHMRSLGEHDEQALDVSRLLYMPVRTKGYAWQVYEGPRTRLDDLKPPAATPPAASSSVAERQSTRASTSFRDTAALLAAKHWPPSGERANARMALVGACIHSDWSREDTVDFAKRVHAYLPDRGDATDAELERMVDTAFAKRAQNEHLFGWPTLENYVGPAIVDSIRLLTLPDPDGAAGFNQRINGPRATAVADDPAATTAQPARAGLGFQFGGWDVEPPPVEFLVDGLIPRGAVAMFFGRADSMKTWLVYSMAISLASGQPWLGRVTRQVRVGIVDYETGKTNVGRRLYMLRAGENPNLGAVSFTGLKPNDPKFWAELSRESFDVVFVDSLRRSNPGADENNSGESIVPLELAAEFSEKTGCAVVWIHHAKKAAGDGWPEFRGSAAIEDQVDCAFAVRKSDVTPARKRVEVRCEKPGDMRTPDPFAAEVEFDDERKIATVRTATGDTAPAAGAAKAPEAHAVQAAILLAISRGEESGYRGLARATGLPENAIKAELRLMIERGDLVRGPKKRLLPGDDPAQRSRILEELADAEENGARFHTAEALRKKAGVTIEAVSEALAEGAIAWSSSSRDDDSRHLMAVKR